MPIFQYRYGDGLQQAKRIVEAGIAGKPYLATVETAWNRSTKYYSVPWRGRLGHRAQGGVLLTHAIHSHDIITWLMGPVASVYCRTATRVNPIEVEDCAVASVVMQSGALVFAGRHPRLAGRDQPAALLLRERHLRERAEALCPGDGPWQITPASPESRSQDRRRS